jgi:energy-coupling factor transport system substrate-specific component
MSWQLASFALVFAALGVALWWYEYSHPSPRLLAIVATLAALAALGRDAFAAVPDVKPTTTIVLVAGIALGAAPGFAIGAISALASNVLLGEGPWTPWQMLGWGVVGAIGALIGRLAGGRPLPPLVLALAAAASAEVFNLVVDVYTWTGTGEHTLAGFGLVVGSASVFDLTHVVASFVFALAFGGVLLRMLMRVRARLHVSWQPAAPVSALLAVILAAGLAGLGSRAPAAGASQARAAGGAVVAVVRPALDRELAYLQAAQNSDGGFGGARGQSSSELYTAWAAMGLAAAGRSPLSVSRNGRSPLSVIYGQASSLQGAGDLERTILALRACGVSVHSLPGGDPVRRLLKARAPDGSFSHLVNLTAFGVFALRAAGYPAASAPVRAAARWLARQQGHDGGFGFAGKGSSGAGAAESSVSDVDDTAAVLEALVDAGRRSAQPAARAAAYLVHAQNPDGGYPQQRGDSSNAQSTAWAVQALSAAGHNVQLVRRHGSRSPLGYLQTLIAPDGSVRYSRTGAQTPVWVTAQALTALAQKPMPIAPVVRHAHIAVAGAASRPPRRHVRVRPRASDTSPSSQLLGTFESKLAAALDGALADLSAW